MKDLLKKVYDRIIYYEEEQIEVGRQLDYAVQEFLQEYGEKWTDSEREELRNVIYGVIHTAQYEGFKIGIKAAIHFQQQLK